MSSESGIGVGIDVVFIKTLTKHQNMGDFVHCDIDVRFNLRFVICILGIIQIICQFSKYRPNKRLFQVPSYNIRPIICSTQGTSTSCGDIIGILIIDRKHKDDQIGSDTFVLVDSRSRNSTAYSRICGLQIAGQSLHFQG